MKLNMTKTEHIYPLKLKCVAKQTVWGGNLLSEKYGKPNIDQLGETWELSVREKEQSIILNGVCQGLTLGEYLDKYTSISSKGFPILIKFIDARDRLSVQLHPQNEKTEMWHILEADDDATIIFGAKDGMDKKSISDAVADGRVEDALRYIKVKAGETYFIPAGMVHAIGKGILLAEIQQNSDTTYRFYDYGRPRELHVKKALECFTPFTDNEIAKIRFSREADAKDGEILASCEYFTVVKHKIFDKKEFNLKKISFMSLLCVEGRGIIEWENGKEELAAGDSIFIPGEIECFKITGSVSLLETTV